MNKIEEGSVKNLTPNTDQKVIAVGINKSENLNISKEDKESFEQFKLLYAHLIESKCLADYGTIDDKDLLEDTAKDLFLQTKTYLPKEDDKLDKEPLDDRKLEESKEIKNEDQYSNERRRGVPPIKRIAEQEVYDNEDWYKHHINDYLDITDFVNKNITEIGAEYNLRDTSAEEACKEIYKLAINLDGVEQKTESLSPFAITEFAKILETDGNDFKIKITNSTTNDETKWLDINRDTLRSIVDNNRIDLNEGKEPDNLELDENGLPKLESPYYMNWYDDIEIYYIRSAHPYDETNYSFARSKEADYTGEWGVYNPSGSLAGIVDGYEEAVELMKELDKNLRPNMSHN